jgi:hypothetical protein
METQSSYLPTTGKLKELGFTHQIEDKSRNNQKYKGTINASYIQAATRLFCKWEESGLYQIAHKKVGQDARDWKFKGFGGFTDEAHFLRLLNINETQTQPNQKP